MNDYRERVEQVMQEAQQARKAEIPGAAFTDNPEFDSLNSERPKTTVISEALDVLERTFDFLDTSTQALIERLIPVCNNNVTMEREATVGPPVQGTSEVAQRIHEQAHRTKLVVDQIKILIEALEV